MPGIQGEPGILEEGIDLVASGSLEDTVQQEGDTILVASDSLEVADSQVVASSLVAADSLEVAGILAASSPEAFSSLQVGHLEEVGSRQGAAGKRAWEAPSRTEEGTTEASYQEHKPADRQRPFHLLAMLDQVLDISSQSFVKH